MCLSHDQFGEFQDVEGLRELVEDSVFSWGRRVHNREFDASQSVSDIQEAATLPALAINRQGHLRYRLDAEAIDSRAENFVIVKAGSQTFIENCFIGLDAIDDSLM